MLQPNLGVNKLEQAEFDLACNPHSDRILLTCTEITLTPLLDKALKLVTA